MCIYSAIYSSNEFNLILKNQKQTRMDGVADEDSSVKLLRPIVFVWFAWNYSYSGAICLNHATRFPINKHTRNQRGRCMSINLPQRREYACTPNVGAAA